MPAKDIYHNAVVQSLRADGWIITHDPLYIDYGGRNLFVDLGAEREAIAAEKDGQKIAVEIKSFTGLSEMSDLEKAIGQYIVYHDVLAQVEPDRVLYLAVSEDVASGLFEEPLGELLLRNNRACLLVFDPETEAIVKWIP